MDNKELIDKLRLGSLECDCHYDAKLLGDAVIEIERLNSQIIKYRKECDSLEGLLDICEDTLTKCLNLFNDCYDYLSCDFFPHKSRKGNDKKHLMNEIKLLVGDKK